MEAPREIWLRLAQRFWRRSLKMVDGWTTYNARTDGQRTDDGACLYYKLTNEPKGSGELKRQPTGKCMQIIKPLLSKLLQMQI